MPSPKKPRDIVALEELHGTKPVPSRVLLQSLGDRTLAWLLALLLCCTMLPLAAFASPDQDATSLRSDTPTATEDRSAPDAPDEALPAEPDASLSTPPENTDDDDVPSSDHEVTGPAEGTDGEENAAPDLDGSRPAPPTSQEPQEAVSFDRTYYANISFSPADESAPSDTSDLCTGATLYASVFQMMNVADGMRVPVFDDGTFSYRWYASSSRSLWGLSEKDAIAGADKSSLLLTDELIDKYLYVKVTAPDGTTTNGPRYWDWLSGILHGVGPIVAAQEDRDPADGSLKPVDPDHTPEVPEVPETPEGSDKPGTSGEARPERPEPMESTAIITVTGTTKHRPGTSFFYSTWISSIEYRWFDGYGVSAWDAFEKTLVGQGYSYETGRHYPSSITSPDGSYALGTTVEPAPAYWAFYLNGKPTDLLSCDYHLQNGDHIELRYHDTSSEVNDSLVVHPEEVTPDAPVIWGGVGTNGTGAATSLVTPTTDLATGWTFDLSEGIDGAGWSEPLMVNDRIYLATATRFCALDRETGQLLGSTPLAGPIDKGCCQPIYVSGKVVVPLANGQLQAFSVSTMHCIWVSESVMEGAAAEGQAMSSLYVHDGRIYVATTTEGHAVSGGRLICLDIDTGAWCWSRENAEVGYRWTGTAQLNGYILVGNDDGVLEAIAIDSQTGEAAGSLALGSRARGRSAAVVSQVAEDDHAYCITRDGVFHKVSVSDNGTLTEVGRVSFAASSTSTPTICDGTAYVGGVNADGSGVLAHIDTDTLSCNVVRGPGGSPLSAEVKGTPLVSKQPTGTFIYFTCAGTSGVYLYKVGDAAARLIYEPSAGSADCGVSSIVAGPDGCLYFVTDRGQLIELKEQPAISVPDTTQKPTAPGPTRPAQTDQLERMMDQMAAIERESLNASPRRIENATTAPTTTPADPTEEEAETETATTRRPISSFIEDLSMQAQDVALVKWVLFASGGLFVGAVVLLAIVLPFYSRRKKL